MKGTHFLKICGLLVFAIIIVGFTAPQMEFNSNEIYTIEQDTLSIFKKLKENNHLSIEMRIALYHQLKKEKPSFYDFKNENGLNEYGYSLLAENKTSDAIEIFKLLIDEFPLSANAYDSMGEAYLKIGNKELALLNYEKSVELDPKNTLGIDQINRLKGLELLVTDWGKEIYHFPIHFATEIKYHGIEEVVFPQNWVLPDSSDFWSYVSVWALDNKKEISPAEMEMTLRIYFDGLAGVVNENKDLKINKTSASFQLNPNPEDEVYMTGKLTVFDAFATKKPLDLNARIYSTYCEEREKLILLFRISPLDYDHEIWDKLRTVKLRSSVCEK